MKTDDNLPPNTAFLQNRIADFWQSVRTGPAKNAGVWLAIAAVYGVAALTIGFSFGIYQLQPLDLIKFWFLPLTLLLFPCVPEEFFFRAMLLPRDLAAGSWQRTSGYVLLSAVMFTLWHPLNALTVNPTAQPFFLNVPFLVIVFLLGITCSLSYILSRSFWVPLAIHWSTVVVWVLFLGGRNLVLEQ